MFYLNMVDYLLFFLLLSIWIFFELSLASSGGRYKSLLLIVFSYKRQASYMLKSCWGGGPRNFSKEAEFPFPLLELTGTGTWPRALHFIE